MILKFHFKGMKMFLRWMVVITGQCNGPRWILAIA